MTDEKKDYVGLWWVDDKSTEIKVTVPVTYVPTEICSKCGQRMKKGEVWRMAVSGNEWTEGHPACFDKPSNHDEAQRAVSEE